MDTPHKTEIKKPLPYSCTKQQLVEMYLDQMPEATIRQSINVIIEASRSHLPTGYKKTTHKVWHKELMEFVDTYGAPKGYEITKNG